MPWSEYQARLGIPATANQLLKQYGLDNDGWTFAWIDKLGRHGECSYRDKEIRYSTNYLGSPLQSIVNTLLHEIAHALAGPGHGHDQHWRTIAKQIGCDGERCGIGHLGMTEHRWLLRCEACDLTWRRHRLNSKHYRSRCPRCKGKLTITDTTKVNRD